MAFFFRLTKKRKERHRNWDGGRSGLVHHSIYFTWSRLLKKKMRFTFVSLHILREQLEKLIAENCTFTTFLSNPPSITSSDLPLHPTENKSRRCTYLHTPVPLNLNNVKENHIRNKTRHEIRQYLCFLTNEFHRCITCFSSLVTSTKSSSICNMSEVSWMTYLDIYNNQNLAPSVD